MSNGIDLEKDLEQFLQYTAQESYKDLIALEGHLETITKGEKEHFCLLCANKHVMALTKYGQECITGTCPHQSIWEEMSKWAEETKNIIVNLLRNKQTLDHNEAKKLIQETRGFRKKMEAIMVGSGIDKKKKILY